VDAAAPESLPSTGASTPNFESELKGSETAPKRKSRLPGAMFACRRSLKVLGVTLIALVLLVGLFNFPARLIDSKALKPHLMTVLFLTGLVLVVLEDHVGVNKAAIMLMVSASMWTFLAVGFHPRTTEKGHEELTHHLNKGLLDVGAIILFLLPAMGVVESIDHFDGFAVVTHAISKATQGRKDLLMPILGVLCFFMSAVIDNLTATIVCLKLLRHAVGEDKHLRHTIGGLVVIAANAGGAWSPVGDVTTTMLWLANKITVGNTIAWLILPSLIVTIFPLAGMWWQAVREARRAAKCTDSGALGGPAGDAAAAGAAAENGEISGSPGADERSSRDSSNATASDFLQDQRSGVTRGKVAVLCMGVACILMVPVLKMATGLPPYLGMLLALGIMWFVTDTVCFQHFARIASPEVEPTMDGTPRTPAPSLSHGADRPGSVVEALHKMDLTGLLFFAGVLLAVGALDTAGVLTSYAEMLVRLCGHSPVAICTLLGVSSAIVDNVPLVQASINMFGETTPIDDPLWQLIALAAGTGGSILSVGSIAGVTLMTMEGVGYLWYCRRVSLWAALGFFLGIGTYQLEHVLFA